MNKNNATHSDDLVGLMPAAGLARRAAVAPCSKEVFPVGLVRDERQPSGVRTKPACEDLLQGFRLAGASRAVVAIGKGKWDIPAFLGDGADYGLPLAYVPIADSPGVPWTVRAALPFLSGARVLFGFPDLGLQPLGAFAATADDQLRAGADIALGLFPARRPELVDMVEVEQDGRVRDVVIKPRATGLRHTWLLACWSTAFSDFLASFISEADAEGRQPAATETYFGEVVRAAVLEGGHVRGIAFESGTYTDIGTPEELLATLRQAD